MKVTIICLFEFAKLRKIIEICKKKTIFFKKICVYQKFVVPLHSLSVERAFSSAGLEHSDKSEGSAARNINAHKKIGNPSLISDKTGV